MEYEELIALNTHTDIINELSANSEAYFNKYNSEWHIDSMETDLGNMLLDPTGEDWFYKDDYIFAYKDWMWAERKQS